MNKNQNLFCNYLDKRYNRYTVTTLKQKQLGDKSQMALIYRRFTGHVPNTGGPIGAFASSA